MNLKGGLNMYNFLVVREGVYKQTRYGSDESPFGRKVKYLDRGGWDGDREQANRYFKEGDILTVKEIYVGRSSSEVEFVEHPGKKFNTVMFEDIK